MKFSRQLGFVSVSVSRDTTYTWLMEPEFSHCAYTIGSEKMSHNLKSQIITKTLASKDPNLQQKAEKERQIKDLRRHVRSVPARAFNNPTPSHVSFGTLLWVGNIDETLPTKSLQSCHTLI